MKKILFVEDETSLQKAFGTILKDKGYDVISAFDGETGLKLAKEVKPNLIILDLILPKVHGFEVLKKLKEEKETQQIPVIVLTNLEDMENVGKALELGAMSYLVKAQYSLEEILEKIKKALGEI
jgi:DNA-binding response OmpR family regulator